METRPFRRRSWLLRLRKAVGEIVYGEVALWPSGWRATATSIAVEASRPPSDHDPADLSLKKSAPPRSMGEYGATLDGSLLPAAGETAVIYGHFTVDEVRVGNEITENNTNSTCCWDEVG